MTKPLRLSVFLWVLFTLSSACGTRAADQVILHLTNGDRLTGTVVSETPNEVLFSAGALGKITIPPSQIKSREKVASSVSTNAPAVAEKAVVPPASQVPVHVTQVPVKPVPSVRKLGPKEWNSEIQLGMNLRYSTKDVQEYLVTAKTTYSHERLRETLDYSFIYGETEGLLSANRMTGSSKTDVDLSKRIYVYNLAGGGYDEIRKIDMQYELGPGFGVNVITRTNFIYKSELGFTYQDQFRDDHTDQKTYSARLGELITWKVSDQLVTEGKFEYFPNLQSFGDYRLRLEGVIRYTLMKHISLNLNVIDLYDTLPAGGVSANDLQIRSALGFKF